MAELCAARTRKGGRCKHPQGFRTQHPGVGRCWLHGGSEPGAQVNGMVQLARRESMVMGTPLSIEPKAAILELMAIAYGEVREATERISELKAEEAVGPVRRTLVRRDGETTVQEVRQDPPQLHIWIQVRHQAMDRLAGYAFAALKANLDERLVKVDEQQAMLMAQAVQGILTELGVGSRPEVAHVVRKHLEVIAGGAP